MWTRCIAAMLALVAVAYAAADGGPRIYQGAISVPGLGDLEVAMSVAGTSDEPLLLMSVPAQGLEDMPLQTRVEDGALIGEVPQLGLVVEVREADGRLVGSMQQGGMPFAIDFRRVAEVQGPNRPQHPQPPFPYAQRELTILHPDGHRLSGTLTTPNGHGPHPCAVLISGSGQQDRDETIFGHKPFLVISDALTRRGIAVMRFDDRGVGGSEVEDTDSVLQATTEDFASDVAEIVRALRWQPDIDETRIGLIGHSEGGMIGPMVAAADDSIFFVVLLAGPGVSGRDIPMRQQELLQRSAGVGGIALARILVAQAEVLDRAASAATPSEQRGAVEALVEAQLSATGQGSIIGAEARAAMIDQALQAVASAWMQYFLKYEPIEVLVSLGCPVLAMNGTLDLQVDHDQNLDPIAEAMTAAGLDITIERFEGLNHLFQPATTGAVEEYAQIEVTFDEHVLAVLGDWLEDQVFNE